MVLKVNDILRDKNSGTLLLVNKLEEHCVYYIINGSSNLIGRQFSDSLMTCSDAIRNYDFVGCLGLEFYLSGCDITPMF